jgi:miniconductance mechanosensitive channel
MKGIISDWLTQQGINSDYVFLLSAVLGVIIILSLISLAYYLPKKFLLTSLTKWFTATRNSWDDILIEHNVLPHFLLLLPFILILYLTPLFIHIDSAIYSLMITFAEVALSFQIARSISSVLNVGKNVIDKKEKAQHLPLNASLQVIKLVVYLVATIFAISFVVDRSPLYLLSGLGALTAVLLLVFQDTIKGLVASIQISANRMLAPGDWIELPKYGADGDVVEIGLNTVKVRNFDNTVTTVPTYALISESFKNWRDMFDSGGRRIKRSIIIDVSSIHFYQADKLNALTEVTLLKEYLTEKQQLMNFQNENESNNNIEIELSSDNKKSNKNKVSELNNRQLTNIGTFRAYIEAYLKQHDKVHHQMTCMVRQLEATSAGLPLELYFFSKDQNWVNYEAIQADIFDHLFAMVSYFDLRVFQHPSGHDWQQRR